MPRDKQTPHKLSTRSRVWLILSGLLIAFAVATLLFPGARPGDRPGALPTFDSQGHRGARGLAPENTLAGFEAALAIGVTTLEMDVGMTRDGVVVVYHDRRLNPDLTRGPGSAWIEPPTPALFELTFADLARYDVGRVRPDSKTAQRFPDQRSLDGIAIPALADVLARTEALTGGKIRYNVEVKTAPNQCPLFVIITPAHATTRQAANTWTYTKAVRNLHVRRLDFECVEHWLLGIIPIPIRK